MITSDDLSIKKLKFLLHYDLETGIFTWRNQTHQGRRIVGREAGSLSRNGYLVIKINQKRYQASRLAWLYVNGEWPQNNIDHIDGNKINNSYSNLRDVSQQINVQNIKKAYSNNTNGHLGIIKRGCRWVAKLYFNGKSRWIGTFDTAEEAHKAYIEVKRNVHEGCII